MTEMPMETVVAGTGVAAGTVAPRRYEVGAGAQCRTVAAGGVAIAWEERGQGLPVVAMHAIGHGSRDYELVAERLSAHARFIAFDWPGHGRSDSDPQPVSVGRYVEVLAGFLDALHIERAVLVGNSIGGAAALAFAARFPARVAALVLADPGGLRPIDALALRVCRLMARLGRAGARQASWHRLVFSLMYRLILRAPSAGPQRRRILAAATECAPLWEQAWSSFSGPGADQSAIGPRIQCPVLFTWAKDDRIIPFRGSKAAVRRFPNHAVTFFEGGHSPHLEAPDAFVAAVAPFLEAVGEREARGRAGPVGGTARSGA